MENLLKRAKDLLNLTGDFYDAELVAYIHEAVSLQIRDRFIPEYVGKRFLGRNKGVLCQTN